MTPRLAYMMLTGSELIRWGIIGIGDVCKFKSGPAFNKVPHSKIQAVCRRTASKAEQWATEHNVPTWYTDASSLISDPEVDAVYIATPPDTHLELGLLVAAAQKPLLVEKPMARNSNEASALAGAFDNTCTPLYVAFYRRAQPRYLAAKELIGNLGRITGVNANVLRKKENEGWRCDRSISGGGYVVDIGSHVVDILDFLLGPLLVEKTKAGRKSGISHDGEPIITKTKSQKEAENYCEFDFKLVLHDNVQGKFKMDFDHDGELMDEICIDGTLGKLRFAALGLYGTSLKVIIQYHDSKKATYEIEPPNPEHAHLPLITQIVNDLRNNTNTCTATSSSGLRATQVIDTALERASSWPRLAMESYNVDKTSK